MLATHWLHWIKEIVSFLRLTPGGEGTEGRGPSSLTALASFPEGRPDPASPPEEERTRRHAWWLIGVRWFAVLIAATLSLVAVRILGLLPSKALGPLLLTIAGLAGFNLLFILLVRQGKWLPYLLPLQIYTDLGILLVLLHFSGGSENLLYVLLLFHVIIAGVLLPRHQCYMVATVASLLFALLSWAEWVGLLEHYDLLIIPHGGRRGDPAHDSLYVASRVGLLWSVLFFSAYFITTLAEQARSYEHQLEAMTDRALAERQLLEQALDATGTGLCVVDQELRPFWINNRWMEWFASDLSASALLMQGVACELPCCLCFQPGANGSTLPLWWIAGEGSPARQTLEDGRLRVTERVLPNPEDDRPGSSSPGQGQRVFQVTTAPLLDRDHKIGQVVELVQEITEQKQAQAQILRAGKLAAIGELAGQVAHEVNNPIAIISAKARLLLSDHREEISDKVAQELAKIIEFSDRVARIAQGLLSYCRPSAAMRAPLDIRIPIQKALAMIEHRARMGEVQIEASLRGAVPMVQANASEMEQVFLNLFLNALDAMPQGGRLAISIPGGMEPLSEGRPCVAVLVEDTGAGIPEESRGRIFDPFFSSKEEGRGTGLGLSICLGIVRSHGGEIEVESQPGKGTRFTLKLPIEAAVDRMDYQEVRNG
ncbi:MAG: hypothetical protein HYY20_09900 [Candidatus Tectomicrobia bacterium]|uniref:histidine kinase n=1 Tax=Tectimicrobiota bacterium TaxID=2528274 RepID=A0A932FXA9_UNCTE|nr:hypothetical protein [Candidatus Tectomicrobia bacterium]